MSLLTGLLIGVTIAFAALWAAGRWADRRPSLSRPVDYERDEP